MLLAEAFVPFFAYLNSLERSAETIRVYRSRLQNFQHYLEQKLNGPVFLEDVDTAIIENYLAYLKTDRHLAPASRAHMRHVLRSLFHYLELRRIIHINPASPLESVKIPSKERSYLSEFEAEQLINQIESPVVQTIVKTLWGTGLRISECLNLTLDAVDLENSCIHVLLGKGSKDRNVPIGKKLTRILQLYIDKQRPIVKSSRFFLTPRGYAVSAQKVNAALQEAARKLVRPRSVTAHILRHSYACPCIWKNPRSID